jgi:hypothetical protein
MPIVLIVHKLKLADDEEIIVLHRVDEKLCHRLFFMTRFMTFSSFCTRVDALFAGTINRKQKKYEKYK